MEKLKIRQVILVEGKYDKIKLESFIDGMILTTDGFRIFKDKEKRELIRTLAKKQGLIVMTDSDVAGFRIRNLVRSVVKDAPVIHVYIPQIHGKEKRKSAPSKEGTLGVEGLCIELLQKLLEEQGVTSQKAPPAGRQITRVDFLEDGLIGGENSSEKRARLLKRLGLPHYLSTNALLQVINRLITYEEYQKLRGEFDLPAQEQ